MEHATGGLVVAKRKKRQIRMAVIPEPESGTRAVIVYTGEGTVVMRGDGNVDLDCGNCGKTIVLGVRVVQIRNLVFKCNACGAFNETLA